MGIDDLFGKAPKGNSLAKNSRKDDLNDRKAVLIGDAMTSGVILSAPTHACYAAGAAQISILVLARADKTP
jgi:hypoxanthine-guanine phosphoribosyltransferase